MYNLPNVSCIVNDPGIILFAVHYNINEELPGVAPGQYNYDINEPTGTVILFVSSLYMNDMFHCSPYTLTGYQ